MKIEAIPPQKKVIPITKLVLATVITTITGAEPTMKTDRDMSVFVYEYSDDIVSAIAAYSMNQALPIQDFERTYFRLRNLMYQTKPSMEGRHHG